MITSSQKLKAYCSVGDIITVKIIENLDSSSWIVSLRGTLLQVRNSTPKIFHEGDQVFVRVVSLDPPQLSLDI